MAAIGEALSPHPQRGDPPGPRRFKNALKAGSPVSRPSKRPETVRTAEHVTVWSQRRQRTLAAAMLGRL